MGTERSRPPVCVLELFGKLLYPDWLMKDKVTFCLWGSALFLSYSTLPFMLFLWETLAHEVRFLLHLISLCFTLGQNGKEEVIKNPRRTKWLNRCDTDTMKDSGLLIKSSSQISKSLLSYRWNVYSIYMYICIYVYMYICVLYVLLWNLKIYTVKSGNKNHIYFDNYKMVCH